MYGSVDGVKSVIPKLAKYIKPDADATDALDIKETDVEKVLADYSARVDAALAGRYSVPLNPAQDVIVGITQDLAAVKLSQMYLTQITAEENVNLRTIRKDAQDLLASLASGSGVIPGVAQIDTPDELEEYLTEIEAEDPIFDLEDPATWQSKI